MLKTSELEIPPDIRAVFGEPPIMVGEDPADYQKLVALVIADVKPQGLQEWLLMKDIVDAEWEILRLRGLKVGMLQAFVPQAVTAQTGATVAIGSPKMAAVRRHMIGVVAGDAKAKVALEKALESYGLTVDVLTATAFEYTIGSQLNADRMADAAYDRRNAAYVLLDGLRERRLKSDAAAVVANCARTIKERYSVGAPPIVPGNGVPD
jgi:hypothetical protein